MRLIKKIASLRDGLRTAEDERIKAEEELRNKLDLTNLTAIEAQKDDFQKEYEEMRKKKDKEIRNQKTGGDNATKQKEKLYKELDAESVKLKDSQAKVSEKKIEILELKEAIKIEKSALESNNVELRKAKDDMEGLNVKVTSLRKEVREDSQQISNKDELL